MIIFACRCYEEGRALVICANKRDIMAKRGLSARQYEKVHYYCYFLCYYTYEIKFRCETYFYN